MRRAAAVGALLLAAAGPPPGALSCTGCHAPGSAMGALDGRAAGAIDEAMADFRAHRRPATLMDRIATGFTPEQTHAIALWFSQR